MTIRSTCLSVAVLAALLGSIATVAHAAPHGKPAAEHVLLLSVDGLHGVDLANWIKSNPSSTLAQLSAHGASYTAASWRPTRA